MDCASAPATLVLEDQCVVAAGSPEQIGLVEADRIIDARHSVVLPALVNAHAHLDLSHIGPVPFDASGDGSAADFKSWVDRVMAQRAVTEESIAASVKLGIALSQAGGTGIIGDIAGVRSTVPFQVLNASGVPGVSYVEVFGIGLRQAAAIEFMQDLARIASHDPASIDAGTTRLGLQPHAPYSCGIEVYKAAAGLGLPLSTHLAETLDEVQFLATGDGPIADLLRQRGAWDDTIRPSGQHPVDCLAEALNGTPIVAAHVNYATGDHIARLARSSISVAYCPRASAYFGHPADGHPPHRYRDMIAAGINVALGTDSLLCLDTPDRISVLDEMRLLYQRDAADPLMLLRMATINGAKALGFDPAVVSLQPSKLPSAGLIAIELEGSADGDPFSRILRQRNAPHWIVAGKPH